MGLKAAVAQLLMMAVILSGGALYTRHHVNSLKRADFTQLEHFEDSKLGNGTRYRVLTRSSDTGGASFTVEVLSRAGVVGFLPDLSGSTPEHSHTTGQQETLAVRQGRLGYWIGHNKSNTRELGPGETLTIPAGEVHTIYNAANSTDLLYTLTHTPAGPMGEAFFENFAGLGWDYGSLDRIHPLQILVIFDGSATQLKDLSGWLDPLVKRVLLPVAQYLGFKADYPSHRSKRGGAKAAASSGGQQQQQQQPQQQQQQQQEVEGEEERLVGSGDRNHEEL